MIWVLDGRMDCAVRTKHLPVEHRSELHLDLGSTGANADDRAS